MMRLDRIDDEKLVEQFFQRDYHDRGMLKWAGFFLSDHTSALKKMFANEIPEDLQEKQDEKEVSLLLAQAWHYKKMVHVQLNQFQHGELVESETGRVLGVDDDQIILQINDDHYMKLELDEIRNVEILS